MIELRESLYGIANAFDVYCEGEFVGMIHEEQGKWSSGFNCIGAHEHASKDEAAQFCRAKYYKPKS